MATLSNSSLDLNSAFPDDVMIKDNSKRSRYLIVVFLLLAGYTFISVGAGIYELSLLRDVESGVFFDESKLLAIETGVAVVAVIQSILFIISVVLFLNWFRRAYANLQRSGLVILNHSESMALWTWFIPFVNLVRPPSIMHEIWKGTQRAIKKLGGNFTSPNLGVLIAFWWTLFIISNFIGNFSLRAAFRNETISELIKVTQIQIALDSLQLPEAILVILIVKNISALEEKFADRVLATGGKVDFA